MLVSMSTEPTSPAVVEFGEGDAPRGREIPGRLGGRLRRVGGDRRLCLAVAVLAGIAGVVSLIAAWYETPMPFGPPGPDGAETAVPWPMHIVDGGSLGSAYVAGLLALAVANVLVLFGPPASRRVVRLVGLTLAAGLVPVLVALSATFGKSGYVHLLRVEYGTQLDARSGVIAAYLGVGLAGLALYLAGLRPASARAAAAAWVWAPARPTHDETAEEVAAAAPLDLTVQPARPFARPDADDGRVR
jgi:hypothetical protein